MVISRFMSQKLIEFFSEQYILIVYLVALIVSILHYKKYYDTLMKYLPIIIAYTFFNELLGYFIRYTDDFAFLSTETKNNEIIYNLYQLIFFIFFLQRLLESYTKSKV